MATTPTRELETPAPPPATPPVVGGKDVKTQYGYRVALVGIAAVIVALGIGAIAFDNANDVATAVGPITTAVGTIVGAFFGISIGSSNQAQTTDAAIKAAAAGSSPEVTAALGITPAPDQRGGH